MSFDIKQTLEDMANAIAGVLSGEWPKIEACVKNALLQEKNALKKIADYRLSGKITDDDMKSQLDDEKEVLEASLLACKVKAKATAQKAVNAAIDVFYKAISPVLGSL